MKRLVKILLTSILILSIMPLSYINAFEETVIDDEVVEEMVDEEFDDMLGSFVDNSIENDTEGDVIEDVKLVEKIVQQTNKNHVIEIKNLSEIKGSGKYKLMEATVVDAVVTIESEWNVILDMNGNKVIANISSGRPINNYGNLTITGNGAIVPLVAEGVNAIGSIMNYGTLVIENGTFGATLGSNGSAVFNNGANSSLTINNGHFYGARAIVNQGYAVINNGTFEQFSGIQAYTIFNANNMVIKNARVIGDFGGIAHISGNLDVATANVTAIRFHALYINTERESIGIPSAIIRNGSFISEKGYGMYYNIIADSISRQLIGVQIMGGEFIGGLASARIICNPDIPSTIPMIKGGRFPNTDVSDYIPDGFIQNPDGLVEVSEIPDASTPDVSLPEAEAGITVPKNPDVSNPKPEVNEDDTSILDELGEEVLVPEKELIVDLPKLPHISEETPSNMFAYSLLILTTIGVAVALMVKRNSEDKI